MKLYPLNGCRAVIFRPGMPLAKWLAAQREKPFALCNASLYEADGRPIGTVLENGAVVSNAGNGFGFGVSDTGWGFGGPWERNWSEYLTGYPGLVQHGAYVEPAFADRYVFDQKLSRIAIGERNGVLTLCTEDGVNIRSFGTDAAETGYTSLCNLDGGGSRFLWYDGKTVYTSTRTPYNAIAFYRDSEPKKEEKPMKIYLSPSAQPANSYAWGTTTEQEQCNRIAEACRAALERCGFSVKKAREGQNYTVNVAESNAWGADLHVPIHTNAGGGRGPAVFVYADKPANTDLAQPVYDALNSVVPVKSDYGVRVNRGLYEILQTRAKCVYIEAAFHDNAEEARWIVENAELLGETICRGLCAACGVDFVPKTEQTTKLPEGYATWMQCMEYYKTHM